MYVMCVSNEINVYSSALGESGEKTSNRLMKTQAIIENIYIRHS